jgi:hypothetical protein
MQFLVGQQCGEERYIGLAGRKCVEIKTMVGWVLETPGPLMKPSWPNKVGD